MKTQVYSYGKIFSALVILVLIIHIYILWLNVWPINGDEAQYWNWGKYLAWGDYSKPPLIGWVIALTTKLLGNGPVGLRLGSPLAYTISAAFIYLSGCRMFSNKVGFWSGLMFLLLPGVSFSSTIISTDPFLLAFWSAAFYGLIRALEKNEICWWLFAGVMLGISFYGKYAAILFSLSFIIFLISSKNHRTLWKSIGPYLLLFVPFIMLIPNLVWNADNHFASMNAVAANADLTRDFFHPKNFLNFFASQFAVFGPILFATLLIILVQINRYIKNDHYKLLFIFTFVTLTIMTVESLLARAHANWSAPAYIAADLLVCAILIERKKMLWLWASLVLHSLVLLGLANLPYLVHTFHVPLDKEMTITGWPAAAQEINVMRATYPDSKVLVDNRMLLTQIMYFANIPMSQVVRWNPSDEIEDQYDIVTRMENQNGKNLLLFSYVQKPVSIENRFTSTQFLKTINLMTLDGQSMQLYAFYLIGFKGY